MNNKVKAEDKVLNSSSAFAIHEFYKVPKIRKRILGIKEKDVFPPQGAGKHLKYILIGALE
ncbi:MAG: hypothetical protein OEX02_05765 [Cyclobacteriaceae bacterium]|nr:hypothetical protein [Cyclobacteriaceae bacterium]